MYADIGIRLTPRQRHLVMPWIMDGRAEVPAAASGPSYTVIASSTVPVGYNLYMIGFGYIVRDPLYDYSGSMRFALTINTAPPFQNQNINATTGNLMGWTTLQRGSPASPVPVWYWVPSNSVVSFIASRVVTAAQAQTVDMLATGFLIPSDLDCGEDELPISGKQHGFTRGNQPTTAKPPTSAKVGR